MGRNVCKFSGVDRIENWKVRIEPGLMLSGPCALGLAVNNAVGHEPLSKFTPGMLRSFNVKKVEGLNSATIGNVMILAVSNQRMLVLILHYWIMQTDRTKFLFRRIRMILVHSDSPIRNGT